MVRIVYDDKAMRNIAGVLDAVGRKMSRPQSSRAISRAMAKALRPLRPDVRSATPKRTGALSRTASVKSSVAKDGEPFAAVGWSFKKGMRFQQMLAVEYGNKRYPNPPKPLKNVWEQNGDEVYSEFIVIHLPEVVDDILAKEALKRGVKHQRVWSV